MTEKLYYTKPLLKIEADKCLNCKNKPCQQACPTDCNPQFFIQKIKENDFQSAANSIRTKNPLGEICGLVCPNRLCVKACTRGKIDHPINIPKIQASLLSLTPAQKENIPNQKKQKFAVIGGGPAGIGAATTLVKNGFSCTLFEEKDKIGGAINLIPKTRLPEQTINKEINNILSLPNLTVQTNSKISDPIKLFEKGFDFIIIATGEQTPKLMKIPGENFAINYLDFLSNTPVKKFKKVAIVGAGNVALDCVHILNEIGVPDIQLFMRRPIYCMRVDKERLLEMFEKKVNIHPLQAPIKIQKKGNKLTLFTTRTYLKNNKLIKSKEKSVYTDFDLIITATGADSDEKISHPKIFYSGDCRTKASSVVEALADGIQTALKIITPLLKQK